MNEVRGKVLPADDPQVVRVRRVLGRVAAAAGIEPLQREIMLRVRGYTFEWEANVVRERQVNAFCLPAGKVFVYTGILEVVGGNDDFLATVVSHEAAHALAHHSNERVARDKSGAGILRNLSYGRMQESEADHVGVFLMAFAGYDPDQAPAFWRKMGQLGGSRVPEILSDHPSDERRFKDLRVWAKDARAAKRAYDQGRVVPAGR